jgi:hypothetical protein
MTVFWPPPSWLACYSLRNPPWLSVDDKGGNYPTAGPLVDTDENGLLCLPFRRGAVLQRQC